MRPVTKLSLALAAFMLAACATGPANLGLLKTELKAYHDTGAYERELAAATRRAESWVVGRAARVTRPAMVLDIDETSLSNYPSMTANDFGYFTDGPCDALPKGPCGAHAWESSARAAALAPTLALYKAARNAGVTVFFITGRREPQRAGTEANLRAAGYGEWGGVSLRPLTGYSSSSEFKIAERARIEAQGFTIIANVGDQESDLRGGHAERTFKLPNPFYFLP